MICPAGHEVIPGPLFTLADVAAWEREHAACTAVEAEPRVARVRCASESEALAVGAWLRVTYRALGERITVARTGRTLLVAVSR